MGVGHGHGHSGGGDLSHPERRAADRARMLKVLAVTVTVMMVEIVGGLVTGSLALLADAGHMATDAAAVLIAFSASWAASRPRGPRTTFGLHRAEILGAMVNAVVLLGVCGLLGVTAIKRLVNPSEVDGEGMLWFAVVGLLANGISLWIMSQADRQSLNVRGAFLEVLTDTLGSVLAIVAGVVIWLTGFERADALASLMIAVLILPRSLSLLKESVVVLLEATPVGLDLAAVEKHLAGQEGVVEVHDLHAWTITSGLPSMSVHVTVTDEVLERKGLGEVLDGLATCMRDHFDLRHATFQVEPVSHRQHEDLGQVGC